MVAKTLRTQARRLSSNLRRIRLTAPPKLESMRRCHSAWNMGRRFLSNSSICLGRKISPRSSWILCQLALQRCCYWGGQWFRSSSLWAAFLCWQGWKCRLSGHHNASTSTRIHILDPFKLAKRQQCLMVREVYSYAPLSRTWILSNSLDGVVQVLFHSFQVHLRFSLALAALLQV